MHIGALVKAPLCDENSVMRFGKQRRDPPGFNTLDSVFNAAWMRAKAKAHPETKSFRLFMFTFVGRRSRKRYARNVIRDQLLSDRDRRTLFPVLGPFLGSPFCRFPFDSCVFGAQKVLGRTNAKALLRFSPTFGGNV